MSDDTKQLIWHLIGPVSELRHNQPHEFVVEDKIVALFLDDENWYAMDSVCAHQGGPLVRGMVADGCVTCPWHGWRYNLANGCNTVTGKPMLDVYPVRIVDDLIEVGFHCQNRENPTN